MKAYLSFKAILKGEDEPRRQKAIIEWEKTEEKIGKELQACVIDTFHKNYSGLEGSISISVYDAIDSENGRFKVHVPGRTAQYILTKEEVYESLS